MAGRITITIPDDLYNRLQAVKELLNVSGICQEAINYAVRIEEIKREKSPNMETLIRRLRTEKEAKFAELREQAVKDGMSDALELSYPDFLMMEESGDLTDETQSWFEDRRLKYIDSDDETLIYLDGWREGILNIWHEVRDKI